MQSKDDLNTILKIFVVAILLLLLWDTLESYLFKKVDNPDSSYEVIEIIYSPEQIKSILSKNEKNSELLNNRTY